MHAIIVGAGLSGLAASLGLSSIGFTVDLLEKHHSFDVRGSTIGLAPNGSKALAEILPNEDIATLTSVGLSIPGFEGVSGQSPWIPGIILHMFILIFSFFRSLLVDHTRLAP